MANKEKRKCASSCVFAYAEHEKLSGWCLECSSPKDLEGYRLMEFKRVVVTLSYVENTTPRSTVKSYELYVRDDVCR